MKDKDPIVDLFESKLKNAEFKVDPSVWTNIASQIPAAGTVTTGLSEIAKIAIATGITTVVVITSVLLINSNSDEKDSREDQIAEIIQVEKTEDTVLDTPPITNTERTSEAPVGNDQQAEQPIFIDEQENNTPAVLDILEADSFINKDFLVKEDRLIDEYIESVEDDVDTELEEEFENDIEEDLVEEGQLEEEKMEVIIPNVFTPNNDGQNDLYHISYSGEMKDVSVVIFNSKGEVVYKSTDPDFNWNGRNMMDEPCPSGGYLFMLTAKDLRGNNIQESRDFQLLR